MYKCIYTNTCREIGIYALIYVYWMCNDSVLHVTTSALNDIVPIVTHLFQAVLCVPCLWCRTWSYDRMMLRWLIQHGNNYCQQFQINIKNFQKNGTIIFGGCLFGEQEVSDMIYVYMYIRSVMNMLRADQPPLAQHIIVAGFFFSGGRGVPRESIP